MNRPAGGACRVIKLGGSLLDLPDLAPRLRGWLASQPPSPSVIVVGGGKFADAVREYDRRHALGDEAAHWLAIHAMSLSAELLAALLSEARVVCSVDSWRATLPALAIFDCRDFLRAQPLRAAWSVTSDSIAARLAVALGAEELALLKSAAPPEPPTRTAAAAAGFVDAVFPAASAELSLVRCWNLRDASPSSCVLAAV